MLAKLIAVKPSIAILDFPDAQATSISLSPRSRGARQFNLMSPIQIGPVAELAHYSDSQIEHENGTAIRDFNSREWDPLAAVVEAARQTSPITHRFLRTLEMAVPPQRFDTCLFDWIRSENVTSTSFYGAKELHVDGIFLNSKPEPPQDGREWIILRFMAQTGVSRTQYLGVKDIWAVPSQWALEEDVDDLYFQDLEKKEFAPHMFTPDPGSILLTHKSQIHRAQVVSPGWRYFMSGYLAVPLQWIESIQDRIAFLPQAA